MSDSAHLFSYAKVNLFLNVVGKRPDGYHELETLFERIDLKDELLLQLAPDGVITLTCAHPEVPTDDSNLVVKAIRAYQNASGWKRGIHATLRKEISVAAGLGGGSSNAAATLLGLQKLSGNLLPSEKLLEIGKSLGADVPFFLSGATWGWALGRGDEVTALDLPARLWHLLCWPGFSIPTKAVYEAFSLTPQRADATLLMDALRDNQALSICSHLFNALEPTVEALYPAIREVKSTMEMEGEVVHPMVSGSGSTVFGVSLSREQAQRSAQVLRKLKPQWRVEVAATKV